MTRHLAIGDVHGCFHALRTLADYVGFTADDTVITLGDYVNRGPDTRAVIEWLIEFDRTHTLVPLRGNHEVMMLDALDGGEHYERFIRVGGAATLKSYSPFGQGAGSLADIPDHHWDFLRDRLRPSFETETHFFVHAGVWPDIPIAEQPPQLLYWERFRDPPPHMSGKTMVCGHTSQKSGLPLANDHAVCIDTFAHGGGWLTCLHVESGTIWQANEQGQRRRMNLDDY